LVTILSTKNISVLRIIFYNAFGNYFVNEKYFSSQTYLFSTMFFGNYFVNEKYFSSQTYVFSTVFFGNYFVSEKQILSFWSIYS
jgi:hypothetical protein